MDDKRKKKTKAVETEQDTVKLSAKKKRLEQRRKIEELMEEKRYNEFNDDYADII